MRTHIRALVVVATMLAVAGCDSTLTSQPTPSTAPSYQASTRPASPAKLTFLTPQDQVPVRAGIVHVQLQLIGGTIVRQTTRQITPTTGHIHFSVNGKLVSMNYSALQDVPLTKGLYQLTAEFVAADHIPFNPRVTTTITVPVQ